MSFEKEEMIVTVCLSNELARCYLGSLLVNYPSLLQVSSRLEEAYLALWASQSISFGSELWLV